MNRRDFLKAAAYGLGGLAVLKPGLILAEPDELSALNLPSGFIHPVMGSANPDPVSVRLICWFDVSGSIDANEYEEQINAMASAIGSQDFQDAVFFRNGPQSLAICVADFGSHAALRIPWLDVRPGQGYKLTQLANEVMGLKRRESGSTNHFSALVESARFFENCPWSATDRNVVDILTDGQDNVGDGLPEEAVEVLARQHEATVNALITVPPNEKDLEEWTKKYLATPGHFIRSDGRALDRGFVKVVARQDSGNTFNKVHKSMQLAFRQKLILEVADIELENLRKAVAEEKRHNIANRIPKFS